MWKTPIYEYLVENLQELDIIMKSVESIVKDGIKKNKESIYKSNTKLYALLLWAWGEARLLKLIHERNIFSDTEKEQILSQKSQISKWELTISIAFDKNKDKYTSVQKDYLIDMLGKKLKPIIELRNKLAHWQMSKPLNNKNTNINLDYLCVLNQENIKSLKIKRKFLDDLWQMVHNLTISPTTFIRDYEKIYNDMVSRVKELDNIDYTKYISMLKLRWKKQT